MVYKCKIGLAPKYLSDMMVEYVPGKALRSANHDLLKVPVAQRINLWEQSFWVLWTQTVEQASTLY